MSQQAEANAREAVETNWDAVTNAFEGKKIPEEKPIIEEKPENQPEDEKPLIEEQEAKPEVKTPEQEAEELKTQAKELGLSDEATKEEVEAARIAKEDAEKPLIEFKPEDIDGAIEPEDGTFAALAIADGIKIEKNFKDYSHEDYKNDLIAPYVKQIEETKALTVESLFTQLKNPDTIAALKLLEMGVPEDKLFQPTKDIENFLAMDAAQLVRADKELLGWDKEMIDAELEVLGSKQVGNKTLLEHEADKLRKTLGDAKEQILNERQTYIQQYESKKEQAILAQKEQEKTQFKKAMDTVSTFMGIPVSAEVKEAILRKSNTGAYDNIITPESKAEFILYKELGQKVLKARLNTASEKGRDEIRTKLAAIPPVTNNNAGAAVNQQASTDPWAAVDKMAKSMGH